MTSKNNKSRFARQNCPLQVSVAMYDVGFGDCFLLTFSYEDGQSRRVLIDCGSSSERKEHMSQVVDKLVEDCEGHVDAVVATHRHKDHISAFGLKGLGEKLEALDPDIVIQPWTEHPNAEAAALEAPTVFSSGEVNHIKRLAVVQKFALHLEKNPTRVLATAGSQTRNQLVRIAALSIPNKKAITRLTSMGKKHAYVRAGAPSGLEELLPGVRVSVLGPPTLKQCEDIRRQTKWDETEFWKLYVRVAAVSGSNVGTTRGHSALFPRAMTDTIAKAPSYVKWVIRKVDSAQFHNVRRIVRELDTAINNTSVILFFEIGDKGLLFPGDAQLENWQFALLDQDIRERLRGTSLYKVGHHGSTNATPKTLWGLFRRRGSSRRVLITLLSTEKGHYHEVPRASLVDALRSKTVLHSTENWRKKLREIYPL